MKPTKEEISLCKQVVEIYIKPMEYGDWWISEDWWKNTKKEALLCSMKKWILSRDIVKKGNFPLWTISDCLEFLREKGFRFILHHYDVREYHLGYGRDDTGQWSDIEASKTPLEACLKAVLAVLEEEE